MDKTRINKLYLEGEAVKVFEEKLRTCGLFSEVVLIDSASNLSFPKRLCFIISNLFAYVLRGAGTSDITMVTPSHNVPCREIIEYSSNAKLTILDEGIQSAQLITTSGKKNPLYRQDFIGKFRSKVSSYFISTNRTPKIELIQCVSAGICEDVKEIIKNSDLTIIDFDIHRKIANASSVLEAVFGTYDNITEENFKNKVLIFTQPIYLYSEEKFKVFKRNLITEIKRLNMAESLIFIKLHPRDDKSRYGFLLCENLIKNPIYIPPQVPFELIASRNIFDVGIGPNSTLIRSKCIRQKIILNEY